MLRRFTLFVGAFALVAVFACSGASQPPKTDADALPPGALVRLGSLSWRHGDVITFVAFPDAKTVLTAGQDGTIRLWDLDTGKEFRRLVTSLSPTALTGVVVRGRAPYGSQARLTLSSDGKTLANILPDNSIQLLSVETGKEIRKIQVQRFGVLSVCFSPDGKTLAARTGEPALALYETDTGKELRQLKGAPAGAVRVVGGFGINEGTGVAFAADGKAIASAEIEVVMQKAAAHIRVAETETGKEIRKIELPATGVSAITYSPDGKTLAFASGAAIHLLEADTAKEVRKLDMPIASAAIRFAPDSKTFAVRGRDNIVRLFETDTGKRLHEFGAAAVAAPVNPNAALILRLNGGGGTEPRDLAFSPDGKVLAIGGQQALRFYNVSTGKEQATPAAPPKQDVGAGHRAGVTAVLVAPDGKTIVTRGADNAIRRWNAATGKELGIFTEPKGTNHVTFAPDARRVALSNVDGTIRIFDVAEGKELHSLRGHQFGATAMAFAPDSTLLATRGGADNMIRLFDVDKGSDVRQIQIAVANQPGPNGALLPGGRGNAGGQGLAFSADGQSIAAFVGGQPVMVRPVGGQPAMNINNSIRLWDIATGKEMRKFEVPPERSSVINIAFSPDGRVLAAENSNQTVSMWEVASGKERGVLGQPTAQPGQPGVVVVGGNVLMPVSAPGASSTLSYSPDGSLLAARGPNNAVRFWDVDAAQELEPLKGHTGAILSLAFAPDGKTLASGSADTTILVWDVATVKRASKNDAANLRPLELELLWRDLLGDDAVKAYKGVRALSAASKDAAPFLRDKVKPATPPDVKKIDQWVIDLDSALFPKRAKAAEELEKLGELAIPALKKVLASSASLELRRRVEPILEKVTTGALSAEQLRMVRAIESLEKMGTSEARQALDALAQGAPGALQTRHAQGALDRLVKQAGPRP